MSYKYKNEILLYYYKVGDAVKVRNRNEIEKAFDQQDKTQGCLFVAQMYECCDKGFKVIKTVKNFFDEHEYIVYRVLPPLYILEGSICRGDAGQFDKTCDHSCYFLWHQDWLEDSIPVPKTGEGGLRDEHLADTHGGGTKKEAEHSYDKVLVSNACQLIDLACVAEQNSLTDNLLQGRIKLVWSTKKKISKAKNRVLSLLKSRRETTTSVVPHLPQLAPGDLVRARSRDDIAALLDDSGASGGCVFTPEMFERCGKTYRVLKHVDNFYDEVKKKMCRCRNIVLLEESVCSGRRRVFPADCDRNCFQFWHTSWLEKVE